MTTIDTSFIGPEAQQVMDALAKLLQERNTWKAEAERATRLLQAQITQSTRLAMRVKELEADNAALVAYGKEAKRRLDGEPSPKYVITEA